MNRARWPRQFCRLETIEITESGLASATMRFYATNVYSVLIPYFIILYVFRPDRRRMQSGPFDDAGGLLMS